MGRKTPAYATAAQGLQHKNERLARASAAGKQPVGSDAVGDSGPGAQFNPQRSPDLEVSDGADQGAPEDPIDPAKRVPEWYRDIIGNPSDWTRKKWDDCSKKRASSLARLGIRSSNTWIRWTSSRPCPPRQLRAESPSIFRSASGKYLTCEVSDS